MARASDLDRQFIEVVIADDPAAVEHFVRRYTRFIHWTARRYTRLGNHDADDVTQRVFVKLLEDDCRRLRSWQGSAFEPFLRQFVHNEALSFARAVLSGLRHVPSGDAALGDEVVQARV